MASQLGSQLSEVYSKYGGLSENGPQRRMRLNSWPEVGAVREGLGCMALLEKLYHWGWALKVQSSQ